MATISMYRKEVIVVILLFMVAIGLRIIYRHASEVFEPIRADAKLYYSAAFNLRFHGIYSIDSPNPGGPKTLTDLPAGYPIFLAMFMGPEKPVSDFITQVTLVQTLMGAIVCVLTYLVARQCLSMSVAMIAGILVSISPHLIAMENYILTESLFLFVLMSGLFIFTISLRYRHTMISFLAGVVITSSAGIRIVACALPIILVIFYFIPIVEEPRKKCLRLALTSAYACGILFTVAVYTYFMLATRGNTSEYERQNIYKLEIGSPAKLMKAALTPPNFVVNGQSHVLPDHRDLNWRKRTEKRFLESPAAYLNWNSWERFYIMWNYDNAYNGDVYIYPMLREGFQENKLLNIIHYTMLQLHWPLFMFTISAPFLVQRRKLPGSFSGDFTGFFVILVFFFYFMVVLSMLGRWLPRYTIPLRPMSYVLAAATLVTIWKMVSFFFESKKRIEKSEQ